MCLLAFLYIYNMIYISCYCNFTCTVYLMPFIFWTMSIATHSYSNSSAYSFCLTFFFWKRHSVLSTTYISWTLWLQDYYKVLEVDYDASDDTIKLSYRRLALVRCCSTSILQANIKYHLCKDIYRLTHCNPYFLCRCGIQISIREITMSQLNFRRLMKHTRVFFLSIVLRHLAFTILLSPQK
jgi:hypothetical protein